MGEIKSTLELVLERTRHLTLSAAEREAQSAAARRRSAAGLVQGYLDGRLKGDELKRSLEGIGGTPAEGAAALRQAVLERLDLEGDPQPLLELLEAPLGLGTAALREVLAGYAAAVEEGSAAAAERQRETLARVYGIRGAAVVPNPEADPDWIHERETLARDFGGRLRRAVASLSGG